MYKHRSFIYIQHIIAPYNDMNPVSSVAKHCLVSRVLLFLAFNLTSFLFFFFFDSFNLNTAPANAKTIRVPAALN